MYYILLFEYLRFLFSFFWIRYKKNEKQKEQKERFEKEEPGLALGHGKSKVRKSRDNSFIKK